MAVSSDTLKLLMDAGFEGDALLAVVRSIEADATPAKSARQERNARHYAKTSEKRLIKTSEQDLPLEEKGFPTPLPKTQTYIPPSPPKGAHGSTPQSDFEIWYGGYPHKIGRGAALKAFPKALSRSSLAELTEGRDRYIRSKPPDRSWCNPATWLNEQRWLDQPDEIAPIPRQANVQSHPDQRFAAKQDNLSRAYGASEAASRLREVG